MGELRDRYHVGHNPPGRITEQEPGCFEEWLPAAGYLITLMREYADSDDEAAFLEANPEMTGYPTALEYLQTHDFPRMRTAVEAVLQDNPPREDVDYSAAVEDNDGRLISFWL